MSRIPHSLPAPDKAVTLLATLLASLLAPLSCSREQPEPPGAELRPPGARLPTPGSSWRPSQPPASQFGEPAIAHRSLAPVAPAPTSPPSPDSGLQSPVELPPTGADRDRWSYLDATQRRLIDAPTPAHTWSQLYLVSAGHEHASAADLEHYHSQIRRLPGGIAYHFVIGNGKRSGDGALAATSRWGAQLQAPNFVAPGDAITIALIGDHSSDPITEAQFLALEELTRYLRARFGPLPLHVAPGLPHPIPGVPVTPSPGIPGEIGARLAPH